MKRHPAESPLLALFPSVRLPKQFTPVHTQFARIRKMAFLPEISLNIFEPVLVLYTARTQPTGTDPMNNQVCTCTCHLIILPAISRLADANGSSAGFTKPCLAHFAQFFCPHRPFTPCATAHTPAPSGATPPPSHHPRSAIPGQRWSVLVTLGNSW